MTKFATKTHRIHLLAINFFEMSKDLYQWSLDYLQKDFELIQIIGVMKKSQDFFAIQVIWNISTFRKCPCGKELSWTMVVQQYQKQYVLHTTLQKKEVFALEESFKICQSIRKPIQFFFSFFTSSVFEFYLMNALVYVDIDQGIHKVKFQSCWK